MNERIIKDDKEFTVSMNFGKILDSYYPHFDVNYRGMNGKFAIDLSIIEGNLPTSVTYMVMGWARNNYRVLEEAWMSLLQERLTTISNGKNKNLSAA